MSAQASSAKAAPAAHAAGGTRITEIVQQGYGLHLKLALAGAVALFACIALLSATLMYRHSAVLNSEIERASVQLQKGMIERGVLLADGMAASMETAIAGYDFAFITETVRTMQAKNENLTHCFLVNAAGVVIVHTDPHKVGTRAAPVTQTAPRMVRQSDGKEVVEITQALVVGGREWGWLVLGFDLTPLRTQAARAMQRGQMVLARSITVAMLVAAMIAVLGLAASVWTSRRLLSPLTQLAEDAAAIATGDLDQEIKAVESSDEIGLLARQFEAMRRSIRTSMSELLVAKQLAEESTQQEKKLRAQIEEHSRLLESKVRERTAELQETNTRLTEYDRLKSEFLSNVSHELRTPLAAISSSAKIIHRYGERDPQSGKRFSKVIMEETERLTRLINDLLDLSKIEAGKADWHLEVIEDPGALIEHVVTTFRPLFQEGGIDLQLSVAADVPAIRGDRDRLIQVFANLCSNAMKFTPRGGSVRVEACASDHEGESVLRVTVTDTGPGIPEEDREVVFERFRQGGGKDKPKGTGLGLAICREVARHHGGAIWAEAPREGGTRMVLVLPAVAPLPEPAA
ncbi:MAG TPA: HAMP domain-containing sensor histidine kinase [Candidatus Limnocylindrales bacterium]|nr:HAMP domain-containing sensor histidine kinase [Candidatus Limnocylindrales bacterium]